MKGDGKRNFEAGILTDDLALVDAAADRSDSSGRARIAANRAAVKTFVRAESDQSFIHNDVIPGNRQGFLLTLCRFLALSLIIFAA